MEETKTDLLNPHSRSLEGNNDTLESEEKEFWEGLIAQYLYPMDEKDEKVEEDLAALRDNISLGFILINAVFIILLYTLEVVSENNKNFTFKIPCSDPNFEAEQVLPIAFAFTLVFGILLTLQFFAMLIHRLSTLLQIAAGVKFGKKKTKKDGPNAEDLKRLREEYVSHNSEPARKIKTGRSERGEDRKRRRRQQNKANLHDLWNDMAEVAGKYCYNPIRAMLDEDIRTKFHYLSQAAQITIAKIIEKTRNDLKDGTNTQTKLADFSRLVQVELQLLNSENQNTENRRMMQEEKQRKIRTMFRTVPNTRPSVQDAFNQRSDSAENHYQNETSSGLYQRSYYPQGRYYGRPVSYDIPEADYSSSDSSDNEYY